MIRSFVIAGTLLLAGAVQAQTGPSGAQENAFNYVRVLKPLVRPLGCGPYVAPSPFKLDVVAFNFTSVVVTSWLEIQGLDISIKSLRIRIDDSLKAPVFKVIDSDAELAMTKEQREQATCLDPST